MTLLQERPIRGFLKVKRSAVLCRAGRLAAGIALTALCGCQGANAPAATGICWRGPPAARGPADFRILARGVDSLDDCAAELEAIHLQGPPVVRGAFQGYYIRVDADGVRSSTTLSGFGYPVFQPSQRREIDKDLRALIQDRNGKAPDAAEISVGRR
jgi:hypothetical protein